MPQRLFHRGAGAPTRDLVLPPRTFLFSEQHDTAPGATLNHEKGAAYRVVAWTLLSPLGDKSVAPTIVFSEQRLTAPGATLDE